MSEAALETVIQGCSATERAGVLHSGPLVESFKWVESSSRVEMLLAHTGSPLGTAVLGRVD